MNNAGRNLQRRERHLRRRARRRIECAGRHGGRRRPTSSNNNQTKNETVNYEISRTVSRIVEPTGTIKKLSVAVLVDGTYEGGKAGEATADQPKKYVARSEEEMKRIEDIVKKAMGYSTERQDQVEVVSIQFGLGVEEPVGTAVEAIPDAAKVWMPYVRYAVGGVLFFLILFMVVKPLMTMLVESAPGGRGRNSGLAGLGRTGRSRHQRQTTLSDSGHGEK